MQYVAFLLNLPWTFLGLCSAVLSLPKSFRLSQSPLAIVVEVRSFWWFRFIPGGKGMKPRAVANGHCVQLGPHILENDLAHELIHVEQAIRQPFIHPFLYVWETQRHGYRYNKYEIEAYDKSASIYTESE